MIMDVIKKPQFLALIATAIFLSWLLLVVNAASNYDALTLTDPLAMINVLFPYFWIILAGFIGVCFVVFLRQKSSLWLHVLLLAQLALMLYYTPFLVGGFSWSPDSLWHGGVASYIPSILSGANFSLTEYGQSYPFSFIITYLVENLFSIDTFTYTLYIFPPICIILISSLAYFFTSRIFNRKTAFLALMLALPTLHYIEPHVSPFATGTVLLLASLVLLTYKGAKALLSSIFLIVAVILTHPISPLFLGIYLFAVLFVNLLFGKNSMMVHSANLLTSKPLKNEKFNSLTFKVHHIVRRTFQIPLMLIFLVDAWWLWTIFMAAPSYIGVDASMSHVFDLSFLTNLVKGFEWTTGGQGFIYPEISQLSLLIYGIFLVTTLSILAVNLFKLRNRQKNDGKMVSLRLTLTLTAVGSGIMSYLLFSSSGERYLLGRGLIFFLLMGSICLASYIVGPDIKHVKIKISAVFLFIIFLVCTFPIVSYSKEAYNTFTPSANLGLNFLVNNIDLSKETLSMTNDQQLASYANLAKGLNLLGFPPDLTRQSPDVVVLRINTYYLMAMRQDLSFSNNTYTALSSSLTEDYLYNYVYSNGKFDIYVKADTVNPAVQH